MATYFPRAKLLRARVRIDGPWRYPRRPDYPANVIHQLYTRSRHPCRFIAYPRDVSARRLSGCALKTDRIIHRIITAPVITTKMPVLRCIRGGQMNHCFLKQHARILYRAFIDAFLACRIVRQLDAFISQLVAIERIKYRC